MKARQLIDGTSYGPDALAIFIDFPNAVKGHAMSPAFRIHKSERRRVVLKKLYFPEWDDNDPVFHAVEVTQFKIPATEVSIPSDSIQQFANGNHNGQRAGLCLLLDLN